MMADMDGEVEAHLHIHTESVLGLQARTVFVAAIPDEHIVLSEGDLADPTLSSELMDCLSHFGDVDTVTVRVKTQSTRRSESEGEFSWAFVTFETEPDAAAAIEAGLSVPVTKDSETLDVKLKVTQAALTGLKTGTEKSRIVQKHTRSEARPTNTSSLVSHLLTQIQQVSLRGAGALPSHADHARVLVLLPEMLGSRHRCAPLALSLPCHSFSHTNLKRPCTDQSSRTT